ncbi:leucine-rich repeat-containing protein 27-like isoform X2 [Glandiceps talaboti]
MADRIVNGDRVDTDEEEQSYDSMAMSEGSSAGLKRRKTNDEIVADLIAMARILGAITLDISGRQISKLPDEIMQLDHIEYLYMEGNNISEIPSDFFESLPKLKWLDLRNNQLQNLPPTVGNHSCLKTLLLEGNQIKELPAELGLLETLTGLNLHSNPLTFPPPKVVHKGIKEILRYLREALKVKNKKMTAADLRMDDLYIDDSDPLSSSSDEFSRPRTKSSGKRRRRVYSGQSTRSTVTSDPSDIEFPRPKSVNLHKPISYDEYRKLQYDKFKRAGALGILGKERRSKKQLQKARIPSPPMIDPIESRIIEERRLAQLRELKQKQMLMEQRRKDQEMLLNWRDETRDLQRKNYLRALQLNREDFYEPIAQAPYDTDPAYMKMMTKEDRIKQEVRNRHEALKNMLSPRSKQRLEETRIARDREVEEKIKAHTKMMRERRQKPKGTPQEEMAAAKRELEMAEALHRELNSRHMDLEYRFKAFTGDVA